MTTLTGRSQSAQARSQLTWLRLCQLKGSYGTTKPYRDPKRIAPVAVD